MRHRLAMMLVCGLVLLGCAAGPALAAHNDRARTKTTSTSATTTGAAGKHAHKHHKPHHATTIRHVPGATAAQGNQVLHDCEAHGQLTQQFTRPELKEALAIMSASTSQYTNCSSVIHDALAHGIKPTKGGGSGGSGSTTTIVIIVVVVLVLLAAIFGGLAIRRRRAVEGGGDGPPADA